MLTTFLCQQKAIIAQKGNFLFISKYVCSAAICYQTKNNRKHYKKIAYQVIFKIFSPFCF